MPKIEQQPTKKDVEEFWNRNVCQTEFLKTGERGTEEFYQEAERVRYKYHFYLPNYSIGSLKRNQMVHSLKLAVVWELTYCNLPGAECE